MLKTALQSELSELANALDGGHIVAVILSPQ